MKAEQEKDSNLVHIRKQMSQENPPKRIKSRYMIIDDVLYFLSHQDDETRARLVTPAHLELHVVQQNHDGNGHMGIDKTYDILQQKYFWTDMHRKLYEYVGGCVVCQERMMQKRKPPAQGMDVPPYTFAKVSLDLSGPYPTILFGNKYTVAFGDHYSGWPEAYAVPDKSADTAALLLMEQIILRHSCPLQLVTDNGTENENRIMRETLK